MSIEDSESIDIVALSPDGRTARLVVSDHLDWEDAAAHLLMLQSKLNTYIAFIEDGSLDQQFPTALGLGREIDVRFTHPLSREGEKFLSQAAGICNSRGVGLVWRVSLQPS